MILNYKAIMKLIGIITIIMSGLMLPSLLCSYIYNEADVIKSFWFTIVPMLIFGSIITKAFNANFISLKIRDGYIIAALCWTLCSALGAIPFVISGYIPNYIDAFFESVSGLTTTGCSILTNVESLPRGLLFWRSFTHWIGGMGIILFAIALLPALGMSGQKLAMAESNRPAAGKITPHISQASKILYLIYISITLLEILLLVLGGMNLFDAMINTFGSVGTGGYSNYSDGIAHYDSLYFETVIAVSMFLAGINFTLYYFVLRGRWKGFFSDDELRFYLLIVSAAILLITLNLWVSNYYGSLGESLRYSVFQSISIVTTTGFMTANYDLWPTFSKMILFALMFIGGCSSSTSGGIKVVRTLILFKYLKNSISMRLHPRAVISIKINEKPISSNTISDVISFVFLYIGVFFIGTLLLSLNNFDLITTASAMATCLGNVGPGFNLVDPTLNYSIFSNASTLLLSFVMLVGRLELFTFILLFTRQFWNPDR